mmetsp:Transcript_12033/g.20875  ORF Transcript_12033/g.20875 Transcript_12033/m.20875 type:complete len:101 (-) Transcript_12033:454-756(-)
MMTTATSPSRTFLSVTTGAVAGNYSTSHNSAASKNNVNFSPTSQCNNNNNHHHSVSDSVTNNDLHTKKSKSSSSPPLSNSGTIHLRNNNQQQHAKHPIPI